MMMGTFFALEGVGGREGGGREGGREGGRSGMVGGRGEGGIRELTITGGFPLDYVHGI